MTNTLYLERPNDHTMYRFAYFFIVLVLPTLGLAQTTYSEQLTLFRETHAKQLLARASAGGPIKSADDLTHMQFYAPDTTYRVSATFQRTPDAEPFDMPTYNGKLVPHVAYGTLSFIINGANQTLTVYQDLMVTRIPQYRDRLFLPFKDATSGEETYGGGRYLDLQTGDIQQHQLTLDFNKAYNPYCAYHEGYPCPIPPKSNVLNVSIRAGEKTYGKSH